MISRVKTLSKFSWRHLWITPKDSKDSTDFRGKLQRDIVQSGLVSTWPWSKGCRILLLRRHVLPAVHWQGLLRRDRRKPETDANLLSRYSETWIQLHPRDPKIVTVVHRCLLLIGHLCRSSMSSKWWSLYTGGCYPKVVVNLGSKILEKPSCLDAFLIVCYLDFQFLLHM
jgi:hypothetical protein